MGSVSMPSFGEDFTNNAAESLMGTAMGMIGTYANAAVVLDINTGAIDAIEFPDQVTGFGEDSVSFANALAAFEG